MRIAYLCHQILPAAQTNSEQLIRSVIELHRHGIEIDLYIPRSPASDPSVSPEAAIARFYGVDPASFDSGLRLVHLNGIGRPGRTLAEGWHDVHSAFSSRKQSYDLVYTRDLFALAIALMLRMPAVLETYRAKINQQRRFAPWRYLCYRRPNLLGVVTHSRFSQRSFVDAGIPADRVLVAYNGYSPELMGPARSKLDARRELGLPTDQRLVVYAGHVGQRKGTDRIIEVARALQAVRFLVVGAVPGSADAIRFDRLAADAGVTNLLSIPRVPPPAVPMYLHAADCLLIPPSSEPLARFGGTVLPMKTFLYLASGRPIVAPDLPDLREILTDDRNALLVSPDSTDAAARAIQRILDQPDLAARLGETARAEATGFTWAARGRRIAEFLATRLQAHRTAPNSGSGVRGPGN